MTRRLAILGGGQLARSVARIVANTDIEVCLWARSERARKRLGKRLRGQRVTDNLAGACADAVMVLVAVPASGFRAVVAQYGETATADQVLLHAVRGVCPGDGLLLPHQVVAQESCVRKIGALGGPLYAPDLGGDRPVAAVLASRFDEAYAMVHRFTANTLVKLHRSNDLVGVEIAGAMSNVSALAVGMNEALGFGDTARGVLLAHGLSEASSLGVALGAQPRTFAGLAGVGDLIPRHGTSAERHHRVGVALASGVALEQALAEEVGEAEGVLSARKAVAEAKNRGMELPLARAVVDVCAGERSAAAAIEDVLHRELRLGLGLGP